MSTQDYNNDLDADAQNPDPDTDIDEDRRNVLKMTAAGAAVASAGGIGTSTVAAYDDDPTFDASQILNKGAFADSFTTVVGRSLDPRYTIFHLGSDIYSWAADEMQWGRDPAQVHLDIYRQALRIADDIERWITERSSHLDENFSMINSTAKIAGASARNEELTESEAQQRAYDAIDDIYSEMQKAIWSWQMSAVLGLEGIRNQIMAEFDNSNDLSASEVFGVEDSSGTVHPVDGFATTEGTHERYNGETQKLHDLVVTPTDADTKYRVTHYGHPDEQGRDYDELGKLVVYEPNLSDYDVNMELTYVEPGSDLVTLDSERIKAETVDKLEEYRSTARNTADQIVSDIYSNYSAGEVDMGDLLSPEERLAMSVADFSATGGATYAMSLAYELGYTTSAGTNFDIEYEPYQYEEANIENAGNEEFTVGQHTSTTISDITQHPDGDIVSLTDSEILKFDPETGVVNSTVSYDHTGYTTLAAGEDAVYIAYETVKRVDFENQTIVDVHSENATSTGYIEGLEVSNGVLWSGSWNDIVGYDLAAGEVVTNHSSSNRAQDLVISGNTVYITSSDGTMAYNTEQDTVNWSATPLGNNESVSIAHDGNSVIVGSYDGGEVVALSPEDGSQKWTYSNMSGEVSSLHHSAELSATFALDENGNLRAIDTEGAEIVQYGSSYGTSEIYELSGIVYVGDGTDGVVALNAGLGTQLATDSNGNPQFDSTQTISGQIYTAVDPDESDVLGEEMQTGEVYLTPNSLSGYDQADRELGDWVRIMSYDDSGGIEDTELDGRFTLNTIRDAEGNEQDSIGTQDNDFKSTSTDDLVTQIEELEQTQQELREALEEERTSGGDDSSGGLLDGFNQYVFWGVLGTTGYAAYKLLFDDGNGGVNVYTNKQR